MDGGAADTEGDLAEGLGGSAGEVTEVVLDAAGGEGGCRVEVNKTLLRARLVGAGSTSPSAILFLALPLVLVTSTSESSMRIFEASVKSKILLFLGLLGFGLEIVEEVAASKLSGTSSMMELGSLLLPISTLDWSKLLGLANNVRKDLVGITSSVSESEISVIFGSSSAGSNPGSLLHKS